MTLVLSLVLLVAAWNLVVVALDPVEVTPGAQEGASWSVGRDTGTREGGERLEWTFVVDPGNRNLVDLDVSLPYRVTVTHHDGQALLSSLASLYLDGERIARATKSISAMPGQAGETWTETVDLGAVMERVVVERERGQGPFGLSLTLDWSNAQADPDSTRFDIEVGPAEVRPADLPGLPGCTNASCAQVLFVGAVVVQGGAVFWLLQRYSAWKRPAGPPARHDGPPGGR